MSYYACPYCSNGMVWVPEYGQYWCQVCQRYHPSPRDPVDAMLFGAFSSPPPSSPCPRCGAPMQFIQQYQRWYCPGCRQYA